MGNKLGRKRQVVYEKYTRPQGLYQHKDVDHKKLRKLILDSKLAPCFPGDDDCGCDLEECPICFLFYPSLNRSRCCMKGICTECFLQMRNPNSLRPTQCPFCKTSNYAVEYRGVKSKEEKGLEQIEEQRVIEAKIRIRQQEVQDEEDRTLKRRGLDSSSSTRGLTEADYCSNTAPYHTFAMRSEEIITSMESNVAITTRLPPLQKHNREEEFEFDLEDIMVMEAIWLSIQENGQNRDQMYTDSGQPEECYTDYYRSSAVPAPATGPSSFSPSGGLACAIAALAERQQTNREVSSNYGRKRTAYNMPGCSRYEDREYEKYSRADIAAPASPINRFVVSEDAGVGTSYEGCNEFFHQDMNNGSSLPLTDPIIPYSYEEQMMVTMAASSGD